MEYFKSLTCSVVLSQSSSLKNMYCRVFKKVNYSSCDKNNFEIIQNCFSDTQMKYYSY